MLKDNNSKKLVQENIINKLFKNTLINEQTENITKKERSEIIIDLLKSRSQRQLSEELNIPQTTLSDWKIAKEYSKADNIHISFTRIISKLENIDSKTFTDWGRLEQIKDIIDTLLFKK